MKAQHTPGPWVVEGSGIYAGERCLFAAIDQRNKQNDLALVAAAPELLDALEIALEQLGGALSRVDAIMQAAIKKAKGE